MSLHVCLLVKVCTLIHLGFKTKNQLMAECLPIQFYFQGFSWLVFVCLFVLCFLVVFLFFSCVGSIGN